MSLGRKIYIGLKLDSVESNWDNSIIAVHTFSNVNKLTVIDGMTTRPRIGLH